MPTCRRGRRADWLNWCAGVPDLKPPGFWAHGTKSLWPRLLSPFEAITAVASARRVGQAGWRAPVPVICCGNATVGGAGKTTLALDIAERLLARGCKPAFLTRGYGGHVARVHRVDPGRDDAAHVGDEPLLLAETAPSYVATDRAAGARAAIGDGANVLVMDDGLQNPTLDKTLALLVIDGVSGFGNARLLPAGPLREPIQAACARAEAAILIGRDRTGAAALLPPGTKVVAASLKSRFSQARHGEKLVAFAGIARPEKFFEALELAGATLVARHSFADHHRYTGAEIAKLRAEARALGVSLATTPKDAARLAHAPGILAIGVALIWHDETEIERLLDRALGV